MFRQIFRPVFTSALVIGVIGLAACSAEPVKRQKLLTEAHYWQRADASSAIYMRGPKAQQLLNRDISRCTVELRELHRLGAIRYVTPAEIDEYGLIPPPHSPNARLDEWDTPPSDGYLRAEHMDFHDFETCMLDKGWERTKHTPYEIAAEGREDYVDAIIGEHYQTRTLQRKRYMEIMGTEDPVAND